MPIKSRNSIKDYTFFGLQNGDGCYCGNDDSNFLPVPAEECNQPCSGDANEICGGSWRLSIFGPIEKLNLETTTTSETTTTETISPTTGTGGSCSFTQLGNETSRMHAFYRF